MSIDLNWDTLTSGSDGVALAEEIRAFIHLKFQTVALPRFLKSLQVHAFDFGSVAPEIELKDICDPLPDFYDQSDGGDDEEEDSEDEGLDPTPAGRGKRGHERLDTQKDLGSQTNESLTHAESGLSGLRFQQQKNDLMSPGSNLGVSTPGIPGGTSNLGYFHSQLATGLSGNQTPLAAMAGGHLPQGWPDYWSVNHADPDQHTSNDNPNSLPSTVNTKMRERQLRDRGSVSTLTSGTTTRPQTREGLLEEDTEEAAPPFTSPRKLREPRIEDLQTVFRVSYTGDIKLSLTAEILLDYPMPSFVGIPVTLNITGLSFDGVAVLAYIRRRAHFCFLSPEDATAAVGADEGEKGRHPQSMRMGGLLHEIKVDSEIGQRDSGKQVLKNVGKVEKFVLEQVRRIFEDEFVYPSFWTFLV